VGDSSERSGGRTMMSGRATVYLRFSGDAALSIPEDIVAARLQSPAGAPALHSYAGRLLARFGLRMSFPATAFQVQFERALT